MHVITSKQRPRKLTVLGSDGRDYMFLLKGHEDLRQDERVMQLFGLVNALMAQDHETCNLDMSIQRYAVIPLSHNVGVSGWLPRTDTLHQLIREYRESRDIALNIEHQMMLHMAPDYDKLSIPMKVEVFSHAVESTTGDDLHMILWLKSKNSEVWLDRRTNFTRSLATMSMAGYILGLGDRHPSNIMLDRNSGRVIHIDFGDCFEIAMHRDKFPEKVPFRLTRMLVSALEASGIEGTYRSSCESVMRVLREQRDSLMALLEAFVHDPLINWRLIDNRKASVSERVASNATLESSLDSGRLVFGGDTNATDVDGTSSSAEGAGQVVVQDVSTTARPKIIVEDLNPRRRVSNPVLNHRSPRSQGIRITLARRASTIILGKSPGPEKRGRKTYAGSIASSVSEDVSGENEENGDNKQLARAVSSGDALIRRRQTRERGHSRRACSNRGFQRMLASRTMRAERVPASTYRRVPNLCFIRSSTSKFLKAVGEALWGLRPRW